MVWGQHSVPLRTVHKTCLLHTIPSGKSQPGLRSATSDFPRLVLGIHSPQHGAPTMSTPPGVSPAPLVQPWGSKRISRLDNRAEGDFQQMCPFAQSDCESGSWPTSGNTPERPPSPGQGDGKIQDRLWVGGARGQGSPRPNAGTPGRTGRREAQALLGVPPPTQPICTIHRAPQRSEQEIQDRRVKQSGPELAATY